MSEIKKRESKSSLHDASPQHYSLPPNGFVIHGQMGNGAVEGEAAGRQVKNREGSHAGRLLISTMREGSRRRGSW